ncbi:uncharacterized protein BDCG_17570 [Blastomyces dermatitidis ER-3]|uniref:Uncharacterized protein n=1 Tax=Ajellomyces dermatitidis (strain ER-3 / ATCC MYA-2586) TaxID=559297 RepID=A0ABX2VZ86_AJEDR|nr:uncharacterized protein BDCG_17570 [Blastomyces dermatitidis ER-3]OAT02455.1 hypothetical protein BDCG_17570 [Blastomyces dermatitidis ER-3]
MKREREKKSITVNKQQQKKIEKKLIEKKIKILFRSQMHFIIQNIKKTALLSEYVNLLTAEIEPETADQKIQDFKMQIDLT